MRMGNYYANIGASNGTRDPVDRYETPDSVTRALVRRLSLPHNIREPACGTGRMARVLAGLGHNVDATDIVEDGVDFLEDDMPADAVVTNPPYRDGLAEAFVRHALEVCPTGPVAMLLRLGFLTSQGRHQRLFMDRPPAALILITPRIIFFKADGSRISGQAHDHAWMLWNVEDMPPVDFVGPDELPDVRPPRL